MTTQLTEKSLTLFLVLILALSFLGYHSIYTNSVIIATSSVTIETPDDNESDDDESQNDSLDEEHQSEEPQEQQTAKEEIESGQDDRSIQHYPRAEQPGQNDGLENSYQVVIPESAAQKESLSERFKPSEIVIPVGSDITWINHDDITHAIVSGKQLGHGGLYDPVHDGIFYSGNMEEGDLFSFQFDELGRFDYYCIPHPWMTGAVIVQ